MIAAGWLRQVYVGDTDSELGEAQYRAGLKSDRMGLFAPDDAYLLTSSAGAVVLRMVTSGLARLVEEQPPTSDGDAGAMLVAVPLALCDRALKDLRRLAVDETWPVPAVEGWFAEEAAKAAFEDALVAVREEPETE